ncbi:MAG: hypothetical protein FWD24_01090 [Treponema sp.]|nr:hypothetical protein [Treponema sp.]
MPQKKIRTLELARVGKWGLDGSEITRKDIAELAETFSGKRPVIVGHDVTDRAPKFGDVIDIWSSTDGNSIIGPVIFSEIGDKLYEGGYYDGWSISMPRRSKDGKRVLHHLAILGAIPPKIPGLEELSQVAVNFSTNTKEAAKSRYQFSGQIPEKEDNDTMTDEEKKAMDEKDAEIAELEKENKSLKEQVAAKQAATEVAAAAAEAAVETDSSDDKFSDMQKQLGELKAARRQERLEGFARDIAEKLPAGIADKAKTLAGHVEAVGAFDFSDNGKTEKRDALWLLGEVLRNWPQPVKTGASNFNYGDNINGENPIDWAAAAKKM